jgi:hypothetical protein
VIEAADVRYWHFSAVPASLINVRFQGGIAAVAKKGPTAESDPTQTRGRRP